MTLPQRKELSPGLRVKIIEKHNRRSGSLTEGIIARILTRSSSHPHGIKVVLEDGRVGRVQAVISRMTDKNDPAFTL